MSTGFMTMKGCDMADRPPNANDVSRRDYKVDWDGQQAPIHTETHFNFIEAQPQIVSKRRHLQVAKGLATSIIISIMIWMLLVKFVL